MAAPGKDKSSNTSELAEVLKPFYQRASQAEDRLSRLEAALASKNAAGNEELLETISDLQSKLEAANAEAASERKKAEILALENAKLQYRIIHLVRAVREVEAKLENKEGCSEAREQTVSKLENLHL